MAVAGEVAQAFVDRGGEGLRREERVGGTHDPGRVRVGNAPSRLNLSAGFILSIAALIASVVAFNSLAISDRPIAVNRVLDALERISWPLACVLMSVVVLHAIRCAVQGLTAMVEARAKAQLQIEALVLHGRDVKPGDMGEWGSLNEVMLKLATAYDQYETPMNATLLNQLRRSIEQKWVDGGSALLKGKNLLWLHSNPHHDVYEANSFELCKAAVHFVFSVDEAVKALSESPTRGYDLIISHMGEHNDAFALKRQLDSRALEVPMVVYTRRAQDLEFRRVAAENGLQRSTNLPHELFNIVLDELGGHAS